MTQQEVIVTVGEFSVKVNETGYVFLIDVLGGRQIELGLYSDIDYITKMIFAATTLYAETP